MQYLSTARNDQEFSWNENSVFKELLVNYSLNHTQYRDTLSNQVRDSANQIKKSVFDKLSKELQNLYLQNQSYDFSIEFDGEIDYKYLLNNLILKISEDSIKHPIGECGSEVTSLAIIAMYRANAKITKSNIIFGLEEPEANLHPQAQKRFLNSLRDKMTSDEVQTIFTTHSTVLIDALGPENIVLVKKETNERGFHSKTSQLSQKIFKDNGIEELKHYQFFGFRNSDFFFSKYVILTESKNDSQVISFLLTKAIENRLSDISILNVDGVNNMKYPFLLLKEPQIPFSIVVDRDFFVGYKNDELSKSRDKNGLPLYKTTLKIDNSIVNCIFNNQQKKTLESKLNKKYRDYFGTMSSILKFTYLCIFIDTT